MWRFQVSCYRFLSFQVSCLFCKCSSPEFFKKRKMLEDNAQDAPKLGHFFKRGEVCKPFCNLVLQIPC